MLEKYLNIEGFLQKLNLPQKFLPGLVAQSVASLSAEPVVVNLIPISTFVEIDYELVTSVILLPLIQEGLLSVTRESMCMKYWLTS